MNELKVNYQESIALLHGKKWVYPQDFQGTGIGSGHGAQIRGQGAKITHRFKPCDSPVSYNDIG